MKPVRRSRFKEPSSWGSLGAMIIGIALMPPENDLLMMLGIAFCALGIALRSAMNEADIRRAGLNNRDADRGVAATSGGDGMKGAVV